MAMKSASRKSRWPPTTSSASLPDLPPKLRYPFVVEYLIERHLLAQYAVKEGIADTEEYKRRLALYQAKALRDAYFFQKIRPQVTEEEMRKVYDEESAKLQQTERVRARHILVGTEQEAKDILARLAKGEKFEDLAKQFSLDGSKDYGGDLGYFTQPEMVPEFSKAAFALKVGETSQPIKTDFGWHIIRLEDRKQGAAQPYDQVKSAIRNVLLRRKVGEVMEKIRAASKVEILDEDLKKYAEDAAKAAKTFQDKKALDQGGGARWAVMAQRLRAGDPQPRLAIPQPRLAIPQPRLKATRAARATCSFPQQ